MENGAGHASTAGHAHIHQRHGHNKLRHGAAGSRRDGVGGKVVDGAVVELDVERLREARARYFATPHENPEEVENAGIKSAEINDSAKRRSWFTSMKDEQADGHELMRGHATKTSVDKSKKQTLREDSVHAHGRPERKPSGNSTCEPPTKSSNVRKSKSAVSPDSGTYRTRRIDWSSVVTRISSGRTKSASKIPSPVKLVEKHDERHGGLVENPCGIAAPIGMNDIDWVKDVKRAGGDRVDGDCRVEPMSSVIRETGNPKLSNTKVSPLMRPSLRRSKTTTNAHPSSSQAESSLSTMLPKQANMHRSTKGAHITPRRTLSDLSLHFPKMAPPEPVQTLECLTCTDEVPTDKAAKLACDHVMCHSCLKHVFEMSITDPHHMPPKCCTSNHIPLRHVDALLTDDFKRTWNKKYQEYTTKNRLYCPKRGCGTWLSAPLKEEKSTGRKYAKCEKCATKVCPNCNGKWHRGSRCPDDTATKEFLEVAKKAGWQTCYNCKATVELKEGCNHMTCRCRAQFCMICGAKWKTCDCPWFSDMNIYYPGHAPRGNPAHRDFPAFNIRPFLRYPQEMEARRRQEQSDEALARRLQMGLIVNDDMDEVPAIFQNYLNPRRAVDVNFPVLRDLAAPLLGAPLAQQAQRLAEGLLNDFFGTNSATPPVEETANSEPGPRLYRQATAQETLSQQGIHQQGTLAPRGNRQPPSTDDVRTLAHDRTPGYWHREENSPTRFIYRPAGSPVGLSAVAGTEGVNTRHARVSDWLNQVG